MVYNMTLSSVEKPKVRDDARDAVSEERPRTALRHCQDSGLLPNPESRLYPSPCEA